MEQKLNELSLGLRLPFTPSPFSVSSAGGFSEPTRVTLSSLVPLCSPRGMYNDENYSELLALKTLRTWHSAALESPEKSALLILTDLLQHIEIKKKKKTQENSMHKEESILGGGR